MNKYEISAAIKNYKWMMQLLINRRLEAVSGSRSLIAQYGIDAAMPKAQNSPSDPIFNEIQRIEKHEKNTRKIRRKVLMIQKHSKVIKGEKDVLVLDMLLDGLPLREIASELNMSIGSVQSSKDRIINKIYESIQNEQSEQIEQKIN